MDMLIILVSILVSIVVGILLNRIFSKQSGDSGTLVAENESLKRTLEERNHRIETLNQQISHLTSERDVERARCEGLAEQLAERAEEHKAQLAVAMNAAEERLREAKEEARVALEKQVAQMKELYEQQLQQLQSSTTQLMEQMREMTRAEAEGQRKLIQEQMQTTSERVLKSRQEELDARNIESVSRIVDPLRESLKLMTEALDTTKREHHDTMTRLDARIEENLRNSRELGLTAERLANALTAEVKVQGNFGEMRLRKLLEDLGLEENTHYITQKALIDKYGKKIKVEDDEDGTKRKALIPDFILRFPNKRDVIVDSKVALTAYERYVNAESAEEKSHWLAKHIEAIRTHVDGLAKKDYSMYLDSHYSKLNFVIMYMFQESALSLALMNDTGLWRYAYDRGVLIMGPQTMYMNLRILELMWVQIRQLAKQEEIIKQAELIIERTQLFAGRLKITEKNMKEVLKDFKKLSTTTADDGKSIITPARNLIKLGVRQKKDKTDLTEIFVEDDEEILIGDEPPTIEIDEEASDE